MEKRATWPVALTIAGSDSGGGAGIQADLKTFAALRVHGTSAITCITAQNPTGVRAIQACSPALVQAQIEAVAEELHPRAAKTGMLYSAGLIRAVAQSLSKLHLPLVVDPVMVSTSGARLLQKTATDALIRYLFPLATVITPNLDETAILWGRSVRNVEEAAEAAAQLAKRFDCAVLVKGGHLKGERAAVDFLAAAGQVRKLKAPFVPGVSTHGTGCTYAAAIAAHLARGLLLWEAVRRAKTYVTGAIRTSIQIGKHEALGF